MITVGHLAIRPRSAAVALLIVCVLAGSLVGLAVAQEGGNESDVPADKYSTRAEVATCARCHPDVVAGWQGGPHDLAYSNERFQRGWAAQDYDSGCLDCHTTGYRPATGEYLAEGVTCQACHGEVPSNHPPAPVDLSRANEACRNCHTVTYAEFRASKHEVAGLMCTSCHYAHNNGLRKGTELQQCLNCHGAGLEGFVAHEAHIESGLSCRQCHGYVRPHQIPPDGMSPTGHDFQERITACLDCHENIDLAPANGEAATGGRTSTEVIELDGRRAALKAAELEAEVQTLTLQNRNQTALHLVQGAVGGLIVGAAAALAIRWRVRNGLKKANGDSHEGTK